MASEIEDLRRSVNKVEEQFSKVLQKIEQMKAKVQLDFKELLDKHQGSQMDLDLLADFVDQPYVIIPKKGDQWYVIVPKFVKMAIGWLDHSTKSYNIFVVTKYSQWLREIPSVLKDKLKFPAALPLKVFDNMLFTGSKLQEIALQKYGHYLWRREGKDRIRIKKGYEFKLLAEMIQDGILPFVPKPIDEEDLRLWSGKGYQKYLEICQKKNISIIQDKAWTEFKNRGAMGIFWAFGSGKSLFGHRLIGHIKGSKLVIVPTLALKQQWLERLDLFNPVSKENVRIETYHSYHKIKNIEWIVVIFDECQHLPAPTFSRLATLKTKYRIGFSGSPFREDGKENYIFALTGHPIGMAWEDLLRLGVIKAPQFRVYILKDKRAKDQKLAELMRLPLKTIVFCDWIPQGKQLSEKLEIPFVYSGTKTEDRLHIIRESDACIISRVAEAGISIQDLERVIEYAYLFGSRMQESQRFGRLMHSAKGSQHIVLMTEKELQAYQKRLNAILSRGFKIEFIR